jgi:organic radical activating enzyme
MNVTLQGGEPFYRKDLNELVGGIVENRMRFNILSNGTLITDEMAALLASTGRCGASSPSRNITFLFQSGSPFTNIT